MKGVKQKLLNPIFCNYIKFETQSVAVKKLTYFVHQYVLQCRSCSNIELTATDEDFHDVDEDSTDASFLELFTDIQQVEVEESEEDIIVEFEGYQSE